MMGAGAPGSQLCPAARPGLSRQGALSGLRAAAEAYLADMLAVESVSSKVWRWSKSPLSPSPYDFAAGSHPALAQRSRASARLALE